MKGTLYIQLSQTGRNLAKRRKLRGDLSVDGENATLFDGLKPVAQLTQTRLRWVNPVGMYFDGAEKIDATRMIRQEWYFVPEAEQ